MPEQRRRRKHKRPSSVKRPSSAYMHFCKAERSSIAKAHPDWKVTDIGRELGKRWRSMSEADKKQYEAAAERDRSRYFAAVKK